MDEGRSKAVLALSWLWIAIVAGYMAWGAIYEAGLMRWLSVWQLEHWGAYYPERTAFVAGFLLAAPAFWFIRRRATIVRAREGSGPGAEARRMGRSARNAAIAGVLAALVAGGAFLLSQRVPDGSENATLYDGARLGSEPAPAGKVRIAGQIEPAARTDYTETGGVSPRVIHYVGFRPDGVAEDAPMRLFVERNVEGREELRTVQAFLPEQTGYLIENGIPPLALRSLEARGVRVARALSAQDPRPGPARALLHHRRGGGPARFGLPRRRGDGRPPGPGPRAARRGAGSAAPRAGLLEILGWTPAFAGVTGKGKVLSIQRDIG